MRTERKDVYAMVTERIIEQMKNGVCPWNQPWMNVGCANCVSWETGKPYSMLNQMLIGEEGEYITLHKCNEQGGHVKQGAKGKMVVFAKKCKWTETKKDAEGNEYKEEHEYMTLRYYHVFNVNDCEGVEPRWTKEPTESNNPIEEAENVVKHYVEKSKVTLHNESASHNAYYSPATDTIKVPNINQYKEVSEYYSTLFHEMVHSTGTKNRCDRGIENNDGFGSETYSAEELVAEIGSAMILNAIGIDVNKTFQNSVAYIDGWARKLKADTKMIVRCASKAEKASDYIMN